MITIQLASPDLLEDKLWYVPDVAFFVLIAFLSFFSMTSYIDTIKQEVAATIEEKIKLVDATKRLSQDLKRYDEMNIKIKDLENKILSLKNITISKIAKFKPIVLLEHLQNLKPEGVWFHSIVDDTERGLLSLKAGAFDNLLVAEFMTSLSSTKYQEADPLNLRSQIYFSQIDLGKIAIKGADVTAGGGAAGAQDAKNADIQAAFNGAQDVTGNNEQNFEITSDTEKLFPELADFPVFELKIKYDEKNIQLDIKNEAPAK